MPIIKQKSQMNDNLYLTYYYGKQEIRVITNIRCGIDDLLPEFLVQSQNIFFSRNLWFHKRKL